MDITVNDSHERQWSRRADDQWLVIGGGELRNDAA